MAPQPAPQPTPQPTPQPAPPDLKGGTTTLAGLVAIIGGALGLLQQVLAVAHGGQVDSTALSTSIGAIAGGVGLWHAADQKQK